MAFHFTTARPFKWKQLSSTFCSLCTDLPSPPLSKNRRRAPSPIFTEGRGGLYTGYFFWHSEKIPESSSTFTGVDRSKSNSLETRAFWISKAEMHPKVLPHIVIQVRLEGYTFVTIETCIPFLWQTWSIPHKAHICTAGIEQWRSCINGENDLETNHRTRDERTPLACN